MIRLLFFIFLTWSAAASAQTPWTLTTADFRSESVLLKGIDTSGVRVAAPGGGGDRTVPTDQFLQVERPVAGAPSPGRLMLHLTGGDRLGGEPASLKGESLVWKSTALGDLTLPARRLVAITAPDKLAPDDRPREDVLTLSNGDTVRGIIAVMTSDTATVQTSDGNKDVPMASVAAVTFAATPGTADTKQGFRLRLDDGSALVVAGLKVDNDKLRFVLGKEAERSIPLDHVSAIEQVNGPVSWLSSRTPSESVYVPFFGSAQDFAARMDHSVTGGPLVFRDHVYTRGIGVHAYSRLSWPLDGKWAAFRTRYAVDGDEPLADLTVRVLLDDKPVYEKQHVRAGALSPVVTIDLGPAKKLTLEVEGGTGYVQDRLDWIEPALLRQKPTESPATQPASDVNRKDSKTPSPAQM